MAPTAAGSMAGNRNRRAALWDLAAVVGKPLSLRDLGGWFQRTRRGRGIGYPGENLSEMRGTVQNEAAGHFGLAGGIAAGLWLSED